MRQRIAMLAVLAGLGGAAMAAAEPGYELLFREGVLDGIAEGSELAYSVARAGRSAPERAGEAPLADPPQALVLALGPGDEVELAVADGEHREQAGRFPASVGNPLIMYFLETVLRDMANQAGGSPFYIRNRIKEAMLAEAEVRPVTLTLAGGETVAGQELVLHPFAKDAARDRMAGFADLAISAQVSDAVPGWYYTLKASAPAPEGSDGPGYTNAITFVPGVTE